MACPRNARHDDAVFGTRDPWDARYDEDLGSSKVEFSPTALAARVITGTATLTVRATPSVLDSRSQSYLDVLVDQIDSFNADALGVDAQGLSQ